MLNNLCLFAPKFVLLLTVSHSLLDMWLHLWWAAHWRPMSTQMCLWWWCGQCQASSLCQPGLSHIPSSGSAWPGPGTTAVPQHHNTYLVQDTQDDDGLGIGFRYQLQSPSVNMTPDQMRIVHVVSVMVRTSHGVLQYCSVTQVTGGTHTTAAVDTDTAVIQLYIIIHDTLSNPLHPGYLSVKHESEWQLQHWL